MENNLPKWNCQKLIIPIQSTNNLNLIEYIHKQFQDLELFVYSHLSLLNLIKGDIIVIGFPKEINYDFFIPRHSGVNSLAIDQCH